MLLCWPYRAARLSFSPSFHRSLSFFFCRLVHPTYPNTGNPLLLLCHSCPLRVIRTNLANLPEVRDQIYVLIINIPRAPFLSIPFPAVRETFVWFAYCKATLARRQRKSVSLRLVIRRANNSFDLRLPSLAYTRTLPTPTRAHAWKGWKMSLSGVCCGAVFFCSSSDL